MLVFYPSGAELLFVILVIQPSQAVGHSIMAVGITTKKADAFASAFFFGRGRIRSLIMTAPYIFSGSSVTPDSTVKLQACDPAAAGLHAPIHSHPPIRHAPVLAGTGTGIASLEWQLWHVPERIDIACYGSRLPAAAIADLDTQKTPIFAHAR